MKTIDAVEALAALAQESRLALFRLLVKRGPQGYCAGELAIRLDIPAPTLSFHLKSLSQAGLLRSRKSGRFVRYSANFALMSRLIEFLTEHCCTLATNCEVDVCAMPRPVPRRKAS